MNVSAGNSSRRIVVVWPKVLDLLTLAGEPEEVSVREDVVEDHQALDGPGHRQRLAESCVGLADGAVESLVVHVKDVRLTGPATVHGGVAPGHEGAKEIVRLLSADDARVGAVLPGEADARMSHDLDEEAGLSREQRKLAKNMNKKKKKKKL